MADKLIPFDIADLLDSDRASVEYLHQVLAGGDKDELRRALAHIAKAKGIEDDPGAKLSGVGINHS
jgi:DNA-binding phage protein